MMASSDFSRIAARTRVESCGAWNPSPGFSVLMVWQTLRLARGVTWSLWHRSLRRPRGWHERASPRETFERGTHRLRPILEALGILHAGPETVRTSRSSRSAQTRTVHRPIAHVRIESATGLQERI